MSTDSKSDELRRTVTTLAHRLGHERQQPSSNNREQDMWSRTLWTIVHPMDSIAVLLKDVWTLFYLVEFSTLWLK